MATLVYDAGALIAADRATPKFQTIHAASLRSGRAPLIPSGALGQAWRDGRRQARLRRVLQMCEIVPLDEYVARGAGVLCARAGTSDVIDASVVLLAVHRGAGVLTSDRGDIEKLVDALEPGIRKPPIFDI